MIEEDADLTGWLKKEAIKWIEEQPSSGTRGSAVDARCSYWNDDLISMICELSSGTDDCSQGHGVSKNVAVRMITYESFFLAAVLLARELRKILSELPIPTNDGHQEIGVPIAITIPEGPFLALSVLTIHMLNRPSPTPPHTFAVMVPIEPSEGKDRLVHMLNDSKPALIVSMRGDDCNRIKKFVSKVSECEDAITSDRMYRSSSPKLVDLENAMRDALQINESEKADLSGDIRNLFEASQIPSIFKLLEHCEMPGLESPPDSIRRNRVSHVVYTSGTTGVPKGCVSSVASLRSYLQAKNKVHEIDHRSTVLLASALSFDPCLSDILATFSAGATLAIGRRTSLLQNVSLMLKGLEVTHVLCTPTLWGMVHGNPVDFPTLRVVALGGEPIPKRIVQAWASRRQDKGATSQRHLRLCSTYGVTEACVYQTFGEVFIPENEIFAGGQDAGFALTGLSFSILPEKFPEKDHENDSPTITGSGESHDIGEIIIYGSQVDELSGYLNRPELTASKFISLGESNSNYSYRTGDRGFIDKVSGRLHILGRIGGEDGMVKVNGVRVELGEIESVLIDSNLSHSSHSVVMDCLASAATVNNDDSQKQIQAFCVLSTGCLTELGISNLVVLDTGVVVTASPLYALLRARARDGIKAGAMPAAFVLISHVPMSPTGKRDRRRLPSLDQCAPLSSLQASNGRGPAILLQEHGTCGSIVADQIVDCLNLQPCQQSLLTTSVDFGMLGGDSLAATRVVRSLYAYHHSVHNTRFLGGEYGQLEGPFNVAYLIRARCLGDYVDMLDQHGVCHPKDDRNGEPTKGTHATKTLATDALAPSTDNSDELVLYEALLEASTLNQVSIALGLLELGADPNFGAHGGRLGKISNRNERKQTFRANPLHLACSHGSPVLVAKLIEKECRFNSPDASGSFPMHLAASSTSSLANDERNNQEDLNRLECVKTLLKAGAPLTMKDGNKQTVLHSAARAGHCRLLEFLMDQWREACEQQKIRGYGKAYTGSPFDWLDRWGRTPVHWTVLNGRVDALRVLIRGGCSPNPPKVGAGKATSVALESPLEICLRLYGDRDGIGAEIVQILANKGMNND